jgi:hypothetical protein
VIEELDLHVSPRQPRGDERGRFANVRLRNASSRFGATLRLDTHGEQEYIQHGGS